MVSIKASNVSWIVYSDHPSIGTYEYPQYNSSYEKALTLYSKIIDEGYKAQVVISQTITTETIFIPFNKE